MFWGDRIAAGFFGTALVLSAYSLNAQDQSGTIVPAETIVFEPLPNAPPGVTSAVIVGDINKPGIYVLRNKWPANATLAPHTHGDKWRIYMVLEGEIRFGFGPIIEPKKAVRLTAGSVVTGPVDLPHYFITGPNGATLHVVAEGPFITTFVGQ